MSEISLQDITVDDGPWIPHEFVDGTDDFTPLTAEELAHMNAGILRANNACDSLSQAISHTLPNTLMTVQTCGRSAVLSFNNVEIATINPYTPRVIYTLPENLRPVGRTQSTCIIGSVGAICFVNPDGTVNVNTTTNGSGGAVYGQVAYILHADA